MSTAEKIFQMTQVLPESAQVAVLQVVEQLASRYPAVDSSVPTLTLQESAEVRGKLAVWEEDWNAPGMEVYDRP